MKNTYTVNLCFSLRNAIFRLGFQVRLHLRHGVAFPAKAVLRSSMIYKPFQPGILTGYRLLADSGLSKNLISIFFKMRECRYGSSALEVGRAIASHPSRFMPNFNYETLVSYMTPPNHGARPLYANIFKPTCIPVFR